jgi:ribose transport system permease protein
MPNPLRKLKRIAAYRELQISVLIVVVILVLLAKKSIFLDINNIDSLQVNIAPNILIGIGMTVLLISGVFDLSVGSVMGLAGVVTSIFLARNTPVPISLLLGLGIGLVFGVINGALVGYLRLNHLIVTIGTMNIGRGLTILLLRGERRFGIGGFPEIITQIGNDKIGGLYLIVWVALVLAVFSQFYLRKLSAGRKLFFVGGNLEVSRLMGLNVSKIHFVSYIVCGLLAALAGILVVMRIGASARYLGEGLELKIIISCLIGGVSLAGGRGTIVGTTLGVIFMTLVGNSFSIFEIGAYWQDVIVGALLIIVVCVDAYINILRQRGNRVRI